MKFCPLCGAQNRSTARFCIQCAAEIMTEALCWRCGTNNPHQARFCMDCAAPLKDDPETSYPSSELMANVILAQRYTVIRKIGHGGMGSVYLVDDNRLPDKRWALKELDTSAFANTQERQDRVAAFQHEANLLASLDHPNLTKVVDCFPNGSRHYLVMDYVDGPSLRQILDARKAPFEEPRVLEWADQLCDVLSYLHSQAPPVIFRDLKPDNILVDRHDSIKLIDFGIARFFKPDRAKDTATFGTVGYAPPEQYGKGQTEARSDIYSLGATLHHLLTLRDPAEEPFRFPPIRSIRPSISRQIEHAIQRAVEQRVEDRWPSAMTMKAALHNSMLNWHTESHISSRTRVESPKVYDVARRQPPTCPHCQELLTSSAIYCPNCFKRVEQVLQEPSRSLKGRGTGEPPHTPRPGTRPQQGTSESARASFCPHCNAPLYQSVRYCPVCAKSVSSSR